jgi:hypothetical protein
MLAQIIDKSTYEECLFSEMIHSFEKGLANQNYSNENLRKEILRFTNSWLMESKRAS